MLPLVLLLWGAAPSPSTAADPARGEAAALEEQAFLAIDKEDWCRAARLFEQAHTLAPTVDLLANAAQAAEFGGDLGGARAFLQQGAALPTATKAQRADAKARIAALRQRIAKGGPGVACPLLPPPPLVVVEPPPPPPPPVVVEPPPSSASTVDGRAWGWLVGGVGGGVAALGVAGVGVGATPWFAHAAAAEKIAGAERDRVDATALQAEQDQARAAWESWGQPATVAGVVGVAVGVAAAAGGVSWALLAPSPE